MDFSFLKSNRFWALVIAGLMVVAQKDFTADAWIQGAIVILGGFIGVRTVDRFGESVGTGRK